MTVCLCMQSIFLHALFNYIYTSILSYTYLSIYNFLLYIYLSLYLCLHLLNNPAIPMSTTIHLSVNQYVSIYPHTNARMQTHTHIRTHPPLLPLPSPTLPLTPALRSACVCQVAMFTSITLAEHDDGFRMWNVPGMFMFDRIN